MPQVELNYFAQLREQETPAVTYVGIVGPELMPMITQRQGLRQVARKGVESPEMTNPLVIAQRFQPHAGCGPVVTVS